jgi:UDP-glucuronate decarboxylase
MAMQKSILNLKAIGEMSIRSATGAVTMKYGPRMAVNDGRAISNFIVQALRGEPLTVYGDGSQTRSFCYVSDLIQALIALMAVDDFTGPVNLGNPEEIPVLDVAETIIKLTKSSSKIIHKSLPEDDPLRRCPDISLAKEKLGWTPRIGLEEGLEKTVGHFKEILNIQ